MTHQWYSTNEVYEERAACLWVVCHGQTMLPHRVDALVLGATCGVCCHEGVSPTGMSMSHEREARDGKSTLPPLIRGERKTSPSGA
jgi:hypothetical protein